MSVVATILAFATGIAARVRSPGLNWAREKRLEAERDALSRSREQLINHIELLERELATQRHMTDHWLTELQRTIRERREIENDRDRLRSRLDAALSPGAQLAQMHSQAQQRLGQQQSAFNSQLNGFCNCVPGRSQVFAAHQNANALVNQLNQT